MFALLKKLLAKFIRPALIASIKEPKELYSLDFCDLCNQVIDDSLVIGFLTKQTITKLLDEGDISSHEHDSFFQLARIFYMKSVEYLLKWCPLNEELLFHAKWVDFTRRLECTFISVEYFVRKYSSIFPNLDIERLNDEFIVYQSMSDSDIPVTVKDIIGLSSRDDYHRVDLFWNFMRSKNLPGSNIAQFELLRNVAIAVLTIPHKNKTPSRSSLDLSGTLSSIVTIKTHIENPLQWQPSPTILDKAKKATSTYNKQHCRQK